MELNRMLFKPLPALLTSRFSDMFPRRSEWGVYWDENINVISVSSPVIFSSFCFSENFVLFSDVNVPPEISVLLICFEKLRHKWILLSTSSRDRESPATSSKLNLPQFLGVEFSRWCFCFSGTLRNSSQQVSVSGGIYYGAHIRTWLDSRAVLFQGGRRPFREAVICMCGARHHF